MAACALCGSTRRLERSHIIPRFVYRGRPTAAAADGPVRTMLCGHCEDRFSADESEFARLVFQPLAAGAPVRAKYGGWLRRFAASVCWRILEVAVTENGLGHFHGRWAPELAACHDTWRTYLNGKRPDVGGHHLHLLPVGAALDAGPRRTPTSSATAQIFWPAHAIGGEVTCTDREAFVCARLGPVILFGLIADPDPRQWRGTRINAEGKFKPRAVAVPTSYRNFLLSRTPPPA